MGHLNVTYRINSSQYLLHAVIFPILQGLIIRHQMLILLLRIWSIFFPPFTKFVLKTSTSCSFQNQLSTSYRKFLKKEKELVHHRTCSLVNYIIIGK